jgi:TrmH family RNA methyltransferase
LITSSYNNRLKEIRKLRDRKYRAESCLAWVEGLRACGEAFTQPEIIQNVVYSPENLHSSFAETLLDKAAMSGIEIMEVSKEAFSSLSGKENPQGFGVIIRQQFLPLDSVKPKVGDLWVVLDRIADPGNLGTIMRTLDAVGGTGVILLDHCTDPYDPTSIRASTGAIFRLNLVKASSLELLEWKHSVEIQMVATVAVVGARDYHSVEYSDPLMVVMGSEREGLLTEISKICDLSVTIPMAGHVDSLNLAEATAIMVYEVFNQRRQTH